MVTRLLPKRLSYWKGRDGFGHIYYYCVVAFNENPVGCGGMQGIAPAERMNEGPTQTVAATHGVCQLCAFMYSNE